MPTNIDPNERHAPQIRGALSCVCEPTISLNRGHRPMEQNTSCPFVLSDEVDKISLVSNITRWRQEKLGRFPKRIKLANRKVAWLRREIEEWSRDPEGWRARHSPQDEV